MPSLEDKLKQALAEVEELKVLIASPWIEPFRKALGEMQRAQKEADDAPREVQEFYQVTLANFESLCQHFNISIPKTRERKKKKDTDESGA